jgi:hypothetical protein
MDEQERPDTPTPDDRVNDETPELEEGETFEQPVQNAVETVQNSDETPRRRASWFSWNREAQQGRRLDDLNLGIELYPENASNFVLRGELFLEKKQFHLARADFEHAVQLLDEQIDSDDWGLVAQAMRDTALTYLRSENSE